MLALDTRPISPLMFIPRNVNLFIMDLCERVQYINMVVPLKQYGSRSTDSKLHKDFRQVSVGGGTSAHVSDDEK